MRGRGADLAQVGVVQGNAKTVGGGPKGTRNEITSPHEQQQKHCGKILVQI